MICAGRNCVYAIFLGVVVCAQATAAKGRGDKENSFVRPTNPAPVNNVVNEFHWSEHNKLSWDDFRGEVRTANDVAAAATHCGIGFKTNTSVTSGKPEIVVYNTFYKTRSWVRADARLPEILEHEQGHFDLCEIYTRKLRDRMKQFDLAVTADAKTALMAIYNEVSSEYETRQQAYERETTHGTNINEQKRWVNLIASEL